jgi:putative DNA methylase
MMEDKLMSDVRLIERWLPIAALSEESVRERRSMTALPPIYYLHTWWARRPLVASRAAILASLLPENTDHKKFNYLIGIHGDPVKTRSRIDIARRTGDDLGLDPYGYRRAFTFMPTVAELREVGLSESLVVVDPTAGGGSIPFESARLHLKTFANDLNPVAALILKATVDYPARFGTVVQSEFSQVAKRMATRLSEAFDNVYPKEPAGRVEGYLWARTIRCPYCSGEVPLSPNWRLTGGGKGIRLLPQVAKGPGSSDRVCEFSVVESDKEQSLGTVSGGDATCPFPDCARVIDGDEVKRQAQSLEMGDKLFAVVFKKRKKTLTKAGRVKEGWEREFRSPTPADNNLVFVLQKLSERAPQWAAEGTVPNEPIDQISNYDRGHRLYGIATWRDMFSPRQFLSHGLIVEAFRSMVEEDRNEGRLTEVKEAAYIYLALSIDKLANYSSRMSMWQPARGVIAPTFSKHNFAFSWSYAEMPIAVVGSGFEWAIEQTRKCIGELIALAFPDGASKPSLFTDKADLLPKPKVTVTCGPGDNLDVIPSNTVDVVVMDPPYGANVMYAELSDFFYVWLKRTAGLVVPELFTRYLTDKDAEAVANKAKFKGQKGADFLATRDYQEKMASIFLECRRILKANGILTVMFTHKDAGAWDALTKGLIESGFIITASWPVNTESESSLHIKDKAAANSTILLVCRPRPAERGEETTYWEDVEPLVAKAVRTRVEEFQSAGISGVDLYLASFGPALEEFSRHWPLKRGTPRPEPLAKKRRKQAELFQEEFDPYAVTPEDALDAARREVKNWILNQLTHMKGRGDLDPTTSWFVLAWHAFKAPVFSYDEGLRLARAVGADLEGELIGRICEKKGSDIKLWDSATRAAKSGLGPADGSRAMIDAIHHAAHRGRTRTLDAALDLIKDSGIENDPQFLAALEAVLEVLPPSRNFVGFDVATGDAQSAADDFDALEKLRRLAFSDRVDEPLQLALFAEEAA